MKRTIFAAYCVALLAGGATTRAAHAQDGTPGDGVHFPQNAVVYSIKDFDLVQAQGASLLGDERRPTLNIFHQCEHPDQLDNCIVDTHWFKNCPIVQRDGLNTASAARVTLHITAGVGAYYPAHYVEDALFKPLTRIVLSYKQNGVTTSKEVTLPVKDLRYSWMYPGNTVAAYNSYGEQTLDLRELTTVTLADKVDDLRVSFCDVAPSLFQLYHLDIGIEDL